MVPSESLAARKSLLRREIIARRQELGEQARTSASAAICEKIKQLTEYKQAQNIAAFAPMNEEVNIWPLIEMCVKDNKTVALPRVYRRQQAFLRFHRFSQRSRLSAGYKGILEPSAQEKIINEQLFDFLIIPAVGIDKSNFRLGYGGGFYDKVLLNCKSAYSCAAIFNCQLIEELPLENHDQPVDKAITE